MLLRSSIVGVLAIGHSTSEWISSRGMPSERVFPFAYFLLDCDEYEVYAEHSDVPYRFIFVGQFIERKRLELLLDALHLLGSARFEFVVIGSGSLEDELRFKAESILPGRVIWKGCLPINDVPAEMAKADCLVLPSLYDGWGAVVSEALMMGTSVVCSDSCGAAGVVKASGRGGIFKSGDVGDLVGLLCRSLSLGRIKHNDRIALATWARCLGAYAGANYLLSVLDYVDGSIPMPLAPWLSSTCSLDDLVGSKK